MSVNAALSARADDGVVSKAVVNQPSVMPAVLDNPNVAGGISWPVVEIHPPAWVSIRRATEEPLLRRARTDAAPISVNGQFEVPVLSRCRQFRPLSAAR